MPGAKLQLKGARRLEQKLLSYGERVYDKHVGYAVRAGARPIIREARAAVSVKSGQLKKSMGSVLRKNKRSQTAYAVIGPRHGFRVSGEDGTHDPAKVAHLVEFGHGGSQPAPPHPFLRPAFEGGKEAARQAIIARLRKAVMQEARRG